jgi:hypothetical protein
MPTVFIPTLLRPLSSNQAQVDVAGATVQEVVSNLDRLFPGIAGRLVADGRLLPNISVAVDGEVTPLGLLETVAPESEVHFVAAIKGGRSA